MKTIVYVDGFNLYYRALKGTKHKWLNLQTLCEAVLPHNSEIFAINYYTARVSSRVDPNSPKDQNTYLNALKTIQNCHIHFGSFQVTEKVMFLVQPVVFHPPSVVAASPTPKYARVVKTEEKGSDVNLGAHLVRDALQGKFEHAAILTNDTDLAEPIRIVVHEAKLPVTLLSPVSRPAGTLQSLATSTRRLEAYLGVSQFPEQLIDQLNRIIQKPANW